MKHTHNIKYISILALASVLFSCSEIMTASQEYEDSKIFYASVSDNLSSKTYIDSELNIYWTKNDQLSIFRSSVNEQYLYQGETGQTEGSFQKIGGEKPGTAYSCNYAIYPYNAANTSTGEGTFSITLPVTQNYVENSFSLNGNTMAAATSNIGDDMFKFRNVCGYLLLKIYGGDKIKSIILRGNNGEKIAGAATLTTAFAKDPALTMSESATTEITLDCGENGVTTGDDAENYTSFWLVVPPVTFTSGFSVIVTNTEGQSVVKRVSKSVAIVRNMIKPMAAFKADFESARDIVSFSLSDGNKTYNAFDISNGYVNVQVPNGTDMTNMTASFMYGGAKITVGDIEQKSGENTHDFSDFVNPVTYTVTSKNGLEKSYIIRMFDLPVVIAATPNGSAITSKTVWTEGCTFFIREADGTPYGKVTDCGSTNLRGRGNATWSWYDKDPYAVKFDSKQSILGMPSHKRWCLLMNEAGYYYSNLVGFELGRRTASLEWTPNGQQVELFLNGKHLGLYLLTEQIKIDKNRVNITELTTSDNEGEAVTGGYLLTYDNTYDEVNKFKSSYYNMPVMFKEPDEDLTTAQFTYMQDYINNFEVSLKDADRFVKREYLNYFDINTYIDQYFVWEMAGDIPCYHSGYTDFAQPRSVYFYKDRSKKMKSGPLWDFNESLFYRKMIICNKCQYYGRLFEDPYFVARVKAKWSEFKARVKGQSGFSTSILDYVNAIHKRIDRASKRDWDMWWKNGDSHFSYLDTPDTQYQLITTGIYDKLDYVESYINSLKVDYDNTSGANEDYDGQTSGGWFSSSNAKSVNKASVRSTKK